MTWFVLGVCLLIAFLLAIKWFVAADPRALAEGIRKGGAVLLGLAGLFFLFTGRFAFSLPLFAIAYLLLNGRLGSAFGSFRFPGGFPGGFAGGSRPTPGQSSDVESEWLDMALDHDTGEISGRIKRGRHAGKELSDLGKEELLEVMEECREQDEDAATLLEAYIDRIFGEEWQENGDGQGSAGPDTGSMTEVRACDILGLQPGASETEIKEAHRRLMKNVHPDKGGSAYLARQINAAKDFLLKSR